MIMSHRGRLWRDLGAEKFIDIKCRMVDRILPPWCWWRRCERSNFHGGLVKDELNWENLPR
jgi:formyltetrahydrofolate synthetase